MLGGVALVVLAAFAGIGFTAALTAANDRGRDAIREDLAANRQALEDLIDAYELETGEDAPIAEVDDHPVVIEARDGQDGRDGRDGDDGTDGRPPTDAEILVAVAAFCLQNNGCIGPTGAPGTPGTNGERGETGASGTPGVHGHDGAPGPACPAGWEQREITGGVLDGWLACAPVGS